MGFLVSQLANGVTNGATYALLAAGLTLIFGVLGIVNFAHGEFYMLGAYAMYVGYSVLGLNYVLAAILAVLAMAVVGAVFYAIVLHRLLTAGWQSQIVATIAVSLLLIQLITIKTSALPKFVPSPLTNIGLSLGEARFSFQRVLVLVCALLAFLGLHVMLRRTKPGKAMRALSQNPEMCKVVGIPEHHISMLAVVLGIMLTAVASVTIAPLGLITPDMGSFTTLKAFAAVVMGGFGYVGGAIVSGFILGIVEALAVGYVSSQYGPAFLFGVMILVLLIRPHGLFGRGSRAI
jgi:branched-chain amino acid transport system permease protein